MAVACTLSVSFRGEIKLNRLQIIAFQIYRNKILVICLVNNEKKVALKDFEYCRKNQMNDDLSHQKIANKNAKYHGLVYF